MPVRAGAKRRGVHRSRVHAQAAQQQEREQLARDQRERDEAARARELVSSAHASTQREQERAVGHAVSNVQAWLDYEHERAMAALPYFTQYLDAPPAGCDGSLLTMCLTPHLYGRPSVSSAQRLQHAISAARPLHPSSSLRLVNVQRVFAGTAFDERTMAYHVIAWRPPGQQRFSWALCGHTVAAVMYDVLQTSRSAAALHCLGCVAAHVAPLPELAAAVRDLLDICRPRHPPLDGESHATAAPRFAGSFA